METISPETTRIGWIGTGVMGASMAKHLLEVGFPMVVHNRTRSKADPLLQRGAQWAESPADLAELCNVVFSIVGYPSDVEAVLLGAEGVIAHMASGGIVVDMTTSRPALAERIAAEASQKGIHAIDAPVSGGDVGARGGTLSIMIGGDDDAVAALEPCWKAMGKTIVHQGGPGSGQHTKMVNQTLIATNMIGVCEALLYAFRAGLDLETVLRSVGAGAAGSWSLSKLGPKIIENDFDPGFYVEHFIKDMGIALDEAKRMKLAMPGLAMAHELYQAVAAQGHAQDGTQALQYALASLSGIDWKSR